MQLDFHHGLLGAPRSTARRWLRTAPEGVVSLDATHLGEPELQQEILTLRRRVQKLAALLQLVLAVQPPTSGTIVQVPHLGGWHHHYERCAA